MSTCTDSPACTQYGAPVPADAPTDADINAALRTTVVALLEAARVAIADADHAGVVTCVGAATDLTQETADFSEPPPGYTRSEDPYEQMCITSEGLFFNSDRGWHRSDGRPLRWLTFEAAWAEHKAACPMASDIQQGLLGALAVRS